MVSVAQISDCLEVPKVILQVNRRPCHQAGLMILKFLPASLTLSWISDVSIEYLWLDFSKLSL